MANLRFPLDYRLSSQAGDSSIQCNLGIYAYWDFDPSLGRPSLVA